MDGYREWSGFTMIVKSMWRAIWRWPAWLYQQHSELWDRAALAVGWSLLYWGCDGGIAAAGLQTFPVQWRVVLAALIWAGGLYRPIVAYALFVAAIAWPLYQISIYVMALALAVLILAAPVAARFLPQTLVVLAAPWIAPFYLISTLPLLAGLWWGSAGGAVVGALAALWLKLAAGMSGAPVDLWLLHGWSMTAAPLYERFQAANSLQTLIWLVEPLAHDSLGLLFNLLQVLAWAAAGFAVGGLTQALPAQVSPGRKAMLGLVPGLILIWAGYVAVPMWLQWPGASWFEPRWLMAQVVWAGAVAWSVDRMSRYFSEPVLGGEVMPAAARPRPEKRPVKVPGSPDLSKKARPKSSSHQDDDIIMLELD